MFSLCPIAHKAEYAMTGHAGIIDPSAYFINTSLQKHVEAHTNKYHQEIKKDAHINAKFARYTYHRPTCHLLAAKKINSKQGPYKNDF